MGETQDFRTRRLPREYDELAPDGSEIRVLMRMSGGQLTHCTLPPHETSDAVYHRTVEEIWYCVRGRGEVWRSQRERKEVTEFEPGICISIPPWHPFPVQKRRRGAPRVHHRHHAAVAGVP